MISSYVVRAICALLIGVLLVMNPEQMTSILVQIIGSLFLVSGIVSLVTYFFESRSGSGSIRPPFPVVGIGSFLFGVFLVSFPSYFIAYLMITLGIILIVAGVGQIWNIIRYRHIVTFRWYMLLLPLLIAGAGVWVIFYPMETASLPFVIFGISSIFYGISEIVNAVRIYRANSAHKNTDL